MDPRLRRLLDASVALALPMAHRFRGISVREVLLIEGSSGWGEFAPFADYSATAASRWLDCAVEAAFGTWPEAVRAEVEVNGIVPAVPESKRMARTAVEVDGCRVLKVRVGTTLVEDERRVAEVREVLDEVLGPGAGAIRLDAGGAWSEDAAIEAIRVLSAYGLEFVEQPCADLAAVGGVRRSVDVPIAVDEGVRTALHPEHVRLAEVADLAILKAAPLGGVQAALRVARSVGVPVVVSGSLDSAVGLGAGLALAGALPDLGYACGFGTGRLLEADVVSPVLRPAAGRMPVTRPAPEALGHLSAPRETQERLRGRLIEGWNAGTAERLGHLVPQ